MATEHEIGREEQRRGWVESSSCRYYAPSSWGPWGEVDIPSSAASAKLPVNRMCNSAAESPAYGSAKASEPAEGSWSRACESTEDGWGEASHGAESPKASWGKTSDSAGDGWNDLYDPDCESEELQEAEISRKCSGLTNLGNTCFMNSVLQCLTYTVPLANRILASQHRLLCKAQEFCAMCAMENHIKVVLSASGRTVSPAFLACNLDQISRSFVPGQQQDAHEFLLFLLEGMQDGPKADGSCQAQICKTQSLVSDIFMGQMKSQVKCKACSHCSDSFDDFLGLNLEIENCNSLKEALSNFLAEEDLQEEVKVSCSHCKTPMNRSKQLSFSKSPQVLVVQLKRYEASEFFPTKIERDIKYDLSLDLTPFISQQTDATAAVQESEWKYNLYAVLVHSGWSTSSGHYYCFVQTSPGIWHCMNDSLVSRVHERTVLNQEAYILFYIREGIKEELHLENVDSTDQSKELSKSFQFQPSKTAADLHLCHSPVKDDSAIDKHFLLGNDTKDAAVLSQALSSRPSRSSEQKQMDNERETEMVYSQAKSAGITKQALTEKDLDSNAALHNQQASKNSHSASKEKSLCEFKELKHSPCVKAQNSLKAERTSSPSPVTNCNRVVINSFENGSQYSYVRLLSRMPSSRRQAFLTSAMSGQEATKQTSPKETSAKEKSKLAVTSKQAHSLQAGMARATSHLLQKSDQHDNKARHNSREKPWAEDLDHINSRKLQRVGGKRIMASFTNSGT